MPERRHSRYTRERTWLALVNQIENTQYALVPYSRTTNGVSLVRIKEGEETRSHVQKVLDEYGQRMEKWQAGSLPEEPAFPRKRIETAILAKSSDYYHYHLAEYAGAIDMVICGLHDAYCLLPVLEMRTNQRYAPRETAVSIQSPAFEHLRKTEYGHNILVTALAKGDAAAIAFLDRRGDDNKFLISVPTRNRIKRQVIDLQTKVYRGRPLAFMTQEESLELGQKISAGMKKGR